MVYQHIGRNYGFLQLVLQCTLLSTIALSLTLCIVCFITALVALLSKIAKNLLRF